MEIIPKNYQGKGNIIDGIKLLVEDYYSITGKKRSRKIIFMRYGLVDGRICTLAEVGKYYKISRERVRQIERDPIENLRDLLEGKHIRRYDCRCHSRLLKEIKKIRREIGKHDVLSEKDFRKLLKEKFGIKEFFYLNFFIKIFEIKRRNIRGDIIFILDAAIDESKLVRDCKKIFFYFLRKVLPVPESRVLEDIKGRRSGVNYIEMGLKSSERLERIKTREGFSYQLKFNELFSLEDYSYRILYEAGKPMHYKELAAEIERRLAKCGVSRHVNHRSLRNQVQGRSGLEPIKRSGKWEFKEK